MTTYVYFDPANSLNTIDRITQLPDGSWGDQTQITINGQVPSDKVDPDVIVLPNGTYLLAYASIVPSGGFAQPGVPIFTAVSTDGVNFTNAEPAFSIPSNGEVSDPSIVQLANGSFLMSAGNDPSGGVSFYVSQNGQSYAPTGVTLRQSDISPDMVLLGNGSVRLYSTGPGGIVSFISNNDGLTWTEEAGVRLAVPVGPDNEGLVSVVQAGPNLWDMVYQQLINPNGPNNPTNDELTLATSTDGLNFTVTQTGFWSPASSADPVVVPPPPPQPVITADMILRDGGNGDYEIYDLGNNTILAAGLLGQVGLEWQVAGLGGFAAGPLGQDAGLSGADTSDMLLRDTNTGQFEVYDVDISNNTITSAVGLGQVGLEWAVAGFGDFTGFVTNGSPGESDMLMRNASTGAFEVYDISNNAISGALALGQVGLEWQVAGIGDFSGNPAESDMLMRNTSTGAFEVYDISHNEITFAAGMGQVGTEWQVAGFGDFSGNPNETDMLMRNASTGAFEAYDISNNAITNALPMGQVGLEWQVAGFGAIDGTDTSDMLMRNTSTGAFEVYDIANNQLTTAASMGQVGTEWSVAGIAVDPPGRAQGGIDALNASLSRLVQAMASFAPTGGIIGTSSPLDQTTTVSPTPSLLAPSNGPTQPIG